MNEHVKSGNDVQKEIFSFEQLDTLRKWILALDSTVPTPEHIAAWAKGLGFSEAKIRDMVDELNGTPLSAEESSKMLQHKDDWNDVFGVLADRELFTLSEVARLREFLMDYPTRPIPFEVVDQLASELRHSMTGVAAVLVSLEARSFEEENRPQLRYTG